MNDMIPLMLAIIDNYDSFTYNLVQAFGEIGLREPALNQEIRVFRNDEIAVAALDQLRPSRLVISPGPCTPRESGISIDAILHFHTCIPILGVCLGHQCIAQAFGAQVTPAPRILHGKTSEIHHDGRTIFSGMANPFTAARYHSLIVKPKELEGDFEMTAWTDQDECMGLRHRRRPLEGVQFHPESFLTPDGAKLLANFLRI